MTGLALMLTAQPFTKLCPIPSSWQVGDWWMTSQLCTRKEWVDTEVRAGGGLTPKSHPSCSLSDMAPYYEALCKSLDWQMDVDLLSKMKKANEDELKRLDEELEDAEKNLGESEIRDAMMAKAEYLCRIGDKVSEMVSPLCTA